jgi:glycosyltransferase involved in cell wall biosynthesis
MREKHRPRKIRLGFIIGSMLRGGTETHLAQLLPELHERRYRVSLLVIGPVGPLAEELTQKGISVESSAIRLFWLPTTIRRVVRTALLLPRLLTFAIRHCNGIISVYLPETVILCGVLLWPLRRRLLLCQRGLLTYRSAYPSFITRLERFAFRQCAFVIANSKRVASELENDGVPAEKIRVVYNGLSTTRLFAPAADRPRTRDLLGVSPNTVVLMVVANLHRYKGHSDLIEALGLLRSVKSLPSWKLFCVGRDVSLRRSQSAKSKYASNMQFLEQKTKDLGITEQVAFLGERTDVPDLLRAADISVLPSHEEGFSNALIESMASGLGIVATDVGGNREALEDGICGIIVPPRKVEKLAAAMVSLMTDPTLRETLGYRAREKALAGYGISTCVDAYLHVYEEALTRIRQPASMRLRPTIRASIQSE